MDSSGLLQDPHATLPPMNGAGIALVSRRHVDLGRMSSAICPAS
ncbi:putative leader peptide [Streptomyces sp. NPDC089799]